MVRLIGEEWEPRTHHLREVFSRIGIPYGFYEPQAATARELLDAAGLDGQTLPVLALRSGKVLVDPSYAEIATVLGFPTEPEAERYDLAIVGAGPAGLAAAVYGASEGLTTVAIDAELPGGQAGTSSRIRNYLGFPTGLSGRDLTNRALEQAWFFGARLVLSRRATAIRPAGTEYVVELDGGRKLTARTVLISTGVSWRRLDVPSLEAMQGAGVFYGAAASDAAPVEGADVFIVGAGNSAGQAAVHLSRSAATVTLVVRGDRLAASMSDYLVRQLDATPNIRIRLRTEVVRGAGTSRLTGLTLRDTAAGAEEEVPADALYVMIGARAAHGVARGDARARRAGLHPHRGRGRGAGRAPVAAGSTAHAARDEPARRVRRRRRAARLREARRLGRRRRKHRRPARPPPPRGAGAGKRSELEFGVQAGWPRIASAIRGKSGHRRAGRWRKPGAERRRKVEQKADRRGGVSGDFLGKGETVG